MELSHQMVQRRTPSIVLLIAIICIPLLSETIYSPALPALVKAFHISMGYAEWSVGVYLFGFAIGVGVWGAVSDHYGRRPVLLSGIFLYALLGFFAFWSLKSLEGLFLIRFLQGLCISTASVITQAILRECFEGARRNKLFALVSLVMGFLPAIGPVIGGAVIDFSTWRYSFLFLGMFGALIGLCAFRWLPETRVLDESKKRAYFSVLKKILLDKYVIFSALFMGFLTGTMYAYYANAPFIYVHELGYTSFEYGISCVVLSIAVSLGSFIAYWCSSRVASRKLLVRAVILNFLIMLLVWIYLMSGGSANVLVIAATMLTAFVFFLMVGLCSPNILSKALVSYRQCLGVAGSIFGLIYYIFVALVAFGIGLFHMKPVDSMVTYFLITAVFFMIFTFFIKE